MKMLQYTVKRFVIMLFTLFIIATATFFLLAATPGDALSARVEKLPDSVAARMYAKYGLDKPVMERYVITMKGLVHGDFGESIIYEGQTVQSIRQIHRIGHGQHDKYDKRDVPDTKVYINISKRNINRRASFRIICQIHSQYHR